MDIDYKINAAITVDQFFSLLKRSGLAARRPIDDLECIEGMLSNSNLVASAWHDQMLIGIARCMTDFHYACYLSDLAVDSTYQNKGVGKALQGKVREALQPNCKLILISAPAADGYYHHLGFERNQYCWVLKG